MMIKDLIKMLESGPNGKSEAEIAALMSLAAQTLELTRSQLGWASVLATQVANALPAKPRRYGKNWMKKREAMFIAKATSQDWCQSKIDWHVP